MSKHGRNRKTNITKIIFLMLLAIFLFSSISLIRWYVNNHKSSKLIEELADMNFENDRKDNKNPVDFENLKKLNSDVVGWIKINKTKINYPILRALDNDYYLTRDINKKNNTCGWIFMDYRNSSKFIDKNTVIFGHNLKSGLMFADLHKFINKELDEETIIEIYTENEKLSYKVFSCYIKEPEEYAIDASITDDNIQKKYIKEILSRSNELYNIVPDKTDKLLTLTTCDKSGKNRIFVHCTCISRSEFEK